MTIDGFRDTIRLILGDREVHGIWNYGNETVDSAVRAVFKLGRGPAGYALVGKNSVSPEPQSGDPWALICYDAALLLVGGEDGNMQFRTKAVSVHDFGDRKRDLLAEMRILIYQIRNGASVFATYQNFVQFVHNGADKDGGIFPEFTGMNVISGQRDIAI